MKNNKIYEIYYKKYPYPFRFGSYHAILRSLTIHGLVNNLYATSRLSTQTFERLLRTRQLIRVLIYYGADSVEAEQAIVSINKAHKAVIATNEDYLYVLSTFFLEPIRWHENYGNREFEIDDINAIIEFWCVIGKRMNINEMPSTLDEWKTFQQEYENKFMGHSEAGQKLAAHSLDELCKQAIPFGLRTFARQLLLGTVDEKIRTCLKMKKSIVSPNVLMKIINKLQPSFEPKRDIVDSVKM